MPAGSDASWLPLRNLSFFGRKRVTYRAREGRVKSISVPYSGWPWQIITIITVPSFLYFTPLHGCGNSKRFWKTWLPSLCTNQSSGTIKVAGGANQRAVLTSLFTFFLRVISKPFQTLLEDVAAISLHQSKLWHDEGWRGRQSTCCTNESVHVLSARHLETIQNSRRRPTPRPCSYSNRMAW